jgi:hypothetical protein
MRSYNLLEKCAFFIFSPPLTEHMFENIYLYFMTEEERFSTIKITKKQKMPIHPPPMLRLEVEAFSAKKIKWMRVRERTAECALFS